MTADGEYFEVYKGWIINPGIIMPAQGICDFNVYLTREEIHEDNPRYRAPSLEDARKWIDEQEHVLEEREALGSTRNWNPAKSYFHGTYNAETVIGIISEGLTPGSSVSSWKGQATSYPIIFEYTDLVAERVYYRPEDFKLLRTSGKPVAIYVDVAEFGAGVRTVDEINIELANILERLEVQGKASPERVGGLIVDKDYRALKELDERLPHIAKEMDAVIDRGPSPGGEDIFKRVVEQAGDIPVYRIDRDEEGEIDWEMRRR